MQRQRRVEGSGEAPRRSEPLPDRGTYEVVQSHLGAFQLQGSQEAPGVCCWLFFFFTFWLLKSEQPQNDHPVITLISHKSCNPLMFGKWIENEAVWLDFCIFSTNIKYSFPGAFETLHCFILKVIKIPRNLICIIFILLNKHDLNSKFLKVETH